LAANAASGLAPLLLQVTTTSAKAGGFEARFYHKIYAEEFGNVRGHFGPINTVAFAPDGRSFTTGGEPNIQRDAVRSYRMVRIRRVSGCYVAALPSSMHCQINCQHVTVLSYLGILHQYWTRVLTHTLLLLLLLPPPGEDGYVRIHHFDMDYFTTRFF
jgi:hypothetical protein